MIVGDINIHMEDKVSTTKQIIDDILASKGLVQHVTEAAQREVDDLKVQKPTIGEYLSDRKHGY